MYSNCVDFEPKAKGKAVSDIWHFVLRLNVSLLAFSPTFSPTGKAGQQQPLTLMCPWLQSFHYHKMLFYPFRSHNWSYCAHIYQYMTKIPQAINLFKYSYIKILPIKQNMTSVHIHLNQPISTTNIMTSTHQSSFNF